LSFSVVVLLILTGLLGYALAQDPQPAPQVTVAPTGGQNRGVQIGICDVVEVFNNCERTQTVRGELQQRQEEIQNQNQQRVEALESLRMEMEGLRRGSEEYNKRLEEMWRLGLEREGWQEAQSAILTRSYQLAAYKIYQQILDVIDQVAEERGLDLVLFKVQQPIDIESGEDIVSQISRRQVLYSADHLDVTEQVLARMNEIHRASPGAEATAPAFPEMPMQE
jgi:Skp family chaperone for outer membrane proteins